MSYLIQLNIAILRKTGYFFSTKDRFQVIKDMIVLLFVFEGKEFLTTFIIAFNIGK